ncbi:isoleucine--tRNA ligase [Thermosulfurimonas dismutans]|uniref:Isoleucine--tRNA ligase n=1 Tax=Thermosulfurimonas dismutans TaxID=999894 RepID=A0A179D6E7_9BACT|nr:isoleucine--tRNA ligase [Thermosulfurimonas dismutans]OAQ21617.1 Isoleucyl-tRNA synthetase [Thermosulfurimonas dismutans]
MDWKETLNLPKTDFPMKGKLPEREPEFLKFWEEIGLYERLNQRQGPVFVLHDGPPYANGHIHMGTALNKVLKDIILKSRRMMGYRAPYVPGWDCHGLPIELNVERELGVRRGELPKNEIRKNCRAYAHRFIDIQREEFRRLGVLGDWDNPYLTMTPEYEATIAREFVKFLASGQVYRRKKPVFWCTHCVTALAEAEVEYENHRSPSIYVKFPLAEDARAALPDLPKAPVSVVIWTTTPWTLPANLAVALNPEFEYVAVKWDEEILLLAEGRLSALCAELDRDLPEILCRFDPRRLEGRHARHPFYDRESLFILADYVTLEAGTGCVHIAPGHGEEDYESGLKYGLEVYSPVDDTGHFEEDMPLFGGKEIFSANEEIIEVLREKGRLLYASEIEHSYPHCWRCKKPVIFRATEQWFISMEEAGLREKALQAIERVTWIPRWGRERIRGMVEKRPDWCLSRQRAWGVPITVFVCKKCGELLREEKYYQKVLALFEKEGTDLWFEREPKELLPEGTRCPVCGNEEFRKEEDILDVWFDSGVSFAAVLERRPELAFPADLYLEGSDQHRGWFQSSLLCAVGTRGVPPYKSVLTHGFVVDGQGRKMSKSLGNVVHPQDIIKKYGAEILRLWVASEDYREDIRLSDEILKRLVEAYRKIRNTCRYLLGVLCDFEPQKHRVPWEELPEFERYLLYRLGQLIKRVRRAYEEYQFHIVVQEIHRFCVVELSALAIDINRDRLYCDHPEDRLRRATQTILYEALEALVRLMAPILSFTAEDIYQYYPFPREAESVHLLSFPEISWPEPDEEFVESWERRLLIRGEITKALEKARQETKLIRSSLEAEVLAAVPAEKRPIFADPAYWEYLAIVSSFKVVESLPEPGEKEVLWEAEEVPGLKVLVRRAPGKKCERCWQWKPEVGSLEDYPALCSRCREVVRRLKEEGRLKE